MANTMKTLTKTKLKELQKTLKDRLSELLAEADEAARDISEESAEKFADPTDQAALELDQSRLLRFKDRERKLIRKIEQALDRIEEGSYGKCDACGSDIDVIRLEARPMTDLCIDCATEAEGEKLKNRLQGDKTSSSSTFV